MKNKPFDVTIFNSHSKRIPIIVFPGFLTAGKYEWGQFIATATHHPVYFINWLSYSPISILTSQSSFEKYLDEIDLYNLVGIRIYTLTRPNLFPLNILARYTSIISNPNRLWNNACNNINELVSEFSKLICDFIDEDEPFILLGHSLGGRIVSEISKNITNPNLLCTITLAGAIGEKKFRENLKNNNKIPSLGYINYHSDTDYILSKIYHIAELFDSTPIGIKEINMKRVMNRYVNLGHNQYVNNNELGRDLRMMINGIQYTYDNNIKKAS